jgi:hypothetical protein
VYFAAALGCGSNGMQGAAFKGGIIVFGNDECCHVEFL